MLSAALTRRPEQDLNGSFREMPPRKTSAQIIGEAKQALNLDNQMRPGIGVSGGAARMGVKTVQTRRPFTPREKERTLFGNAMPEALREQRPPSSFTLSPLQFDTSCDVANRNSASLSRLPLARPMSRFLPLLSISAGDALGGIDMVNPQSSLDRRIHRHQFRTNMSLCDLPEESEDNNEEGKQMGKKALGLVPRSSTFTSLYNKNPVELSNSSSMDEMLLQSFDGTTRNVSKRMGVDRSWKRVSEVPPISKDTISGTKETNQQKRANESMDTEGDIERPKVDQPLYFEEKVSPILDEIIRAIISGATDDIMTELIQKLYDCLETGGLLGRHFQYRTQVLKTVFKLVDREKGTLLASLARIMLALKVRGSNLTSVCKLVFKVTRHDSNDSLFLEGNLLDLVLEAVACTSPIDQPEACVYGYGALKFLTMNSQLLIRLLHRGVLELLVLHMKIISTQKAEGEIPDQTGYALVQLTGTLRHVSSCERAFPLMLVTGAVEQVCKLFQIYYDDPEITANIVRVLSIISTQEECCLAAASVPGIFNACMKALINHADRPAVVVRLAYALGNMLTNNDETRLELFNVEGFSDTIFSLLSEYLQRDREEEVNSLLDPLTPASGTAEDVIIKLIRILANISVHPEVGAVLAVSDTCLTMLVSVVGHKALEESEELLLSALATLNNLTFYTRHKVPTKLHKDLAEGLTETLPMDDVEALIETIRVFGNLTHAVEIRDILAKKEVLEVLIEMLDCDSRELVFVCAGVLVNMMSDSERRSVFQQEKGVQRIIDVLQYFGYGDWQLCSLVCQVLWNYCASASDIHDCLEVKEAERLIIIMEEFLDDDTYFNNPEILGSVDPDNREAIYTLWEDFAAVAVKLLDRIEENFKHEENGVLKDQQ